jgi:hypothetical protein
MMTMIRRSSHAVPSLLLRREGPGRRCVQCASYNIPGTAWASSGMASGCVGAQANAGSSDSHDDTTTWITLPCGGSQGCCGARAYLDVLTDDVALYALPGRGLEALAERIAALASANETLTKFHQIRRSDIESGKSPSVMDSLAALQRA